jgi:hypothetical protein
MMSDEKGRIYVFRKKSILDEDRNEIVDIFSKEGLYLYQIKLPLIQRALLFSIPISICNGSIYFSDYSTRDELGVAIPKLKRLRIKEYESLKY